MDSINKGLRTLAMAGVTAASLSIAAPALAVPDVNPPTLHGFCALGNICTDNGTDTPTSVQPPVFGFASSGGNADGTLWIDILVPNNDPIPVSFGISGALSGTATLYSTTAWTSGFLKDYLGGLDASPANGIDAYLPSTQGCSTNPPQGCDPGATGYYVFVADLGSTTLLGTSGVGGTGQDNYLMTLDQDLAAGGYILGFLQQTDDYGATANSGAILETNRGVPEPATWAMMVLGFGAAGVAIRRSRRKKPQLVSQLA